ncbi:MetQ/NlpA family ABC transporter substrate-binding protein [Streptomyces sp. AJS327]|uniref:MetQ/NlpA family ABC transporter substrate-binding protein n=1 Tax=Streptomyces sp. AJS327 TaxID=2545265 RepID=UPI0027E57547|nr:MetQ/NlpA family ABC transporter substrate-binding protein [Streptomyces sp. AJS327]
MGGRRTAALAAVVLVPVGLLGYGLSSDGENERTVTVAASPAPHAEILEYVRDNLAEDAGIDLRIREFNDYVVPNTATESGEVDANFFQHKPYLDDFNKKEGTEIVPVVNVELEPLGIYSRTVDDLEDVRRGQTVAVPNDTTNGGRALQLLAEHDLITLKPGRGDEARLSDVRDARGLKLRELEAASVPRALDDVDLAVVNGNYALEADLNPARDALAAETAKGNPYVNFLAVKNGRQDDPRVRKLADLLTSDEVKRFIERKYQGAIVPAFGAPAS